ncbi:MAG: VanZ family protein [Betaproteobacteria bacterium]|nr:VanZ family protein [Betaproteobacteria bacterium]
MRLRKLWLAIGYALVAAIVYLSLTPRPPTLDIEQGDKLGHLLAYGTLMFWFCQLYAARRSRIAHALAFTAMGVALEYAQRATGYRHFEYLDMLANAAGVALGWAAAHLTGGETLRRLERALLP